MAIANRKCCDEVSSFNTCNKCCEDCIDCFDIDILSVIDDIDNTILHHSENLICETYWGYGCKPIDKDNIQSLLMYKELLSRHNCLCPNELQDIVEKVDLITIKTPCGGFVSKVLVDDSGEDKWLEDNPLCAAYELWEKRLYQTCVVDLSLSVDGMIKDGRSIGNITEGDRLSPSVVLAISIYSLANECDVEYDIKIDKRVDCKMEYNYIVKKFNCDMSYDVYTKLIDCSLSPKVISNVIDCGYTWDYDIENNCPVIVKGKETLPIKGLDINVFTNQTEFKEYILSLDSTAGAIKEYSNPQILQQ